MLQLEVTACMGWGYGHAEAVRDRIAEALLGRFQPEYESMVEIGSQRRSDRIRWTTDVNFALLSFDLRVPIPLLLELQR